MKTLPVFAPHGFGLFGTVENLQCQSQMSIPNPLQRLGKIPIAMAFNVS